MSATDPPVQPSHVMPRRGDHTEPARHTLTETCPCRPVQINVLPVERGYPFDYAWQHQLLGTAADE